ncbi:MAG: Xaa-Pro peptidase family protein [Granulosicoccus sp.]|nr:Xaa-Pro peptidase family protein [Granulosicoccus sp.]
MTGLTPDQLVAEDHWSDLSRSQEMPFIDQERLRQYRQLRLKLAMEAHSVSLCVMTSPISLRYAINYRNYALFMSHIPSTYLFYSSEGDFILYNAFEPDIPEKNKRKGQPIAYMYGGEELTGYAEKLATDIENYLIEIGSTNRRVAIEYVNPGITLALAKRNIEVIDGVLITEQARLIKNVDEISCIRWAIAVAEHGAAKMQQSLQPGVSEVQLWALLNYANLANDGDWHDGRMLASGPRINPWLQEASKRKVEAGDLVGFDTDMVGPNGYFADLSRTFFCGPGKPSKRQRELYQLAYAEVEHNMKLVKPGISFQEFQQQAYPVEEEYHQNAYPCIIHGVGMCDEYPNIDPVFRQQPAYDGVIEAGMVLCVESYMGAVGERDGVKLEQQVLVTDQGCELLTSFPFDEELLS